MKNKKKNKKYYEYLDMIESCKEKKTRILLNMRTKSSTCHAEWQSELTWKSVSCASQSYRNRVMKRAWSFSVSKCSKKYLMHFRINNVYMSSEFA